MAFICTENGLWVNLAKFLPGVDLLHHEVKLQQIYFREGAEQHARDLNLALTV